MATNKLGPGTVNIGVNLPVELRTRLEALARRSGKKLSSYVRDILEETVAQGVVYEQVKTYSASAAEKKQSPYGDTKSSKKQTG